MAYKTEIQIGVRGAKELEQAFQRIKKLSNLIDQTNKREIFGTKQVASVDEYARALSEAEKNLSKTRLQLDDAGNATKTYKKAIDQYVSALGASNQAQKITNDLVRQEINNRSQATAVLKAYNAEAAKPRQPGSMAGSYLRPGQARGTTQYSGPIGPGPASQTALSQPLPPSSRFFGGTQYQFPIGPQPDAAAAFMRRTEAAAAAAKRLTADFIVSQRAARQLAEEQRRINSAEFIARTDAAAKAVNRQNAEFIRQQRITKEIQKNIRSGTQYDKPIGPQPAKRKTRLEQFGDFGLGAGFPLLFGGGAGQVLGGALGTVIGGGGPESFGLQIAFSAIGGQLEDALGRIREIDRATQNLDMDALSESAILVNAELRETVQLFVDIGENQRAIEVATNAIALQTGVLPGSIRESSDAVLRLSNTWDETVSIVSGLAALVATDFINALALTLKVVNLIGKGINFIASGIREIDDNKLFRIIAQAIPTLGPLVAINDTLDGTFELIEGIDESAESRLTKLRQTGTELDKEFKREKEIFDIEQRRIAGTTAAAELNNAQVVRDVALAKLRQTTEDQILAKRREFAGVTNQIGEAERERQIRLISELADIERQRILKKFSLDETAAGLQREKELRKEIINDAQTQLTNEQRLFQVRQQNATSAVELERARFDAQLSTLQFQEAGLQRELQGLQAREISYGRQRQLVNEIAKNQIKQARIQNQVAKLQNQQGVVQARIAQQQIKFEVQKIKLQIQSLKLQAQGIENEAAKAKTLSRVAVTEQQTGKLIGEMVQSGKQRLQNAIEIARQKDIVADNILRGKLESIEAERVEARRTINARSLAVATSQAADEAARLNSNMSKGISGVGGLGSKKTYTASTSIAIDPDVRQSVMDRAPAFGYSSVYELIEALEKAQKLKNAQMSVPSSSSYAEQSFRAPTPLSSGGGTANVNVNTGPVVQFENERYVTLEDFESGLRDVASSMTRNSRSYGSRRYTGIS